MELIIGQKSEKGNLPLNSDWLTAIPPTARATSSPLPAKNPFAFPGPPPPPPAPRPKLEEVAWRCALANCWARRWNASRPGWNGQRREDERGEEGYIPGWFMMETR